MAVYVLVDETRRCCKIGYSKDKNTLDKRVKSLQTASPFKLDLYCVKHGLTLEDERRFHSQLEKHCTGGGREWFDLTKPEVSELVKYIAKLPESDDCIIKKEVKSEPKENTEDKTTEEKCECDCCCEYEDECNCDTDISAIDECCKYCVWRESQFSDLTFEEFENQVASIKSDTWTPPNFFRLAAYLGEGFKPITTADLANYLASPEVGFATFASAACIAQSLTDEVFPESGDASGPVYPVAHIRCGLIVIAIPGEFSECMIAAEDLYLDYFWPVDAAGSQLLVCCINYSREVKYVPYGLIWTARNHWSDGVENA
jgi:hypothetical protein